MAKRKSTKYDKMSIVELLAAREEVIAQIDRIKTNARTPEEQRKHDEMIAEITPVLRAAIDAAKVASV